MSHVSLRVTNSEKTIMESYAKVQGVSLSDAIKDVFFQKLEDEYDLQTMQLHRERKAKGDVVYYSIDDVISEMGLDD